MELQYNLNALQSAKTTLDYQIGDSFFAEKDYSLIKSGSLTASITISKADGEYRLALDLRGTVTVECMRCLDDMTVDIDSQQSLKVILSDRADENDDECFVANSDGILDLDALIYEYAVLALPARCVHADGECNETMAEQLGQYLVNRAD